MHLCSRKGSRAARESAVELDSVGTRATSLGWGTGKPWVPRAGKGRAEHPGFVSFSLCPGEPIPGQISLGSSWDRGKLGPMRHRWL